MLTVVWNTRGFHLVDAIPRGEKFSAWYFIDNILTPICVQLIPTGRRKLVIQAIVSVDDYRNFAKCHPLYFSHNENLPSHSKVAAWLVAFEYKECDRVLKEGEEIAAQAKRKWDKVKAKKVQNSKHLDDTRREIRVLSARRGGEERAKFNELDTHSSQLEKDSTKVQTLREQAGAEVRLFHEKLERIEAKGAKAADAIAAKRSERDELFVNAT
jgi:hypothetical protein